ncbi:MAG: HAMP domain-containing protein, partial [Anaerolineales bacterium]
MRTKLILSFALVVLISVIGVVEIARYTTAGEVRAFMFPGGMMSSDELVKSLEGYYQQHLSWQGVEDLLIHRSGYRLGQGWGAGAQQGGGMMHGYGGMMGQRLRLADASGKIIYDSSTVFQSSLTADEIANSTPLYYNHTIVGYLLLEGGMGFTRADESRLVTRISRAAILAGILAGIVALVIALILAYELIKPVRELTLAVQKIASGDLSQRVKVSGNDEIGLLGKTFNQMAESLHKAEEMRKALTADIAHELRNPLAVQRANLEAMLDGVYPLTIENIQPILEQNQLLTRLVEDLRTLALADAGQLSLEKVPMDMKAFCEHVTDTFQLQAQAKGLQLKLEDQRADKNGPAFILGDPQRLEQILGNLISNAIRYSPPGGEVKIRLNTDAKDLFVQVKDSGNGIPPDALPYIFDRFYRADKSRS